MRLITAKQLSELLDNGIAAARGERRDPLPVVKLFVPGAGATWLLSELDPRDRDTAFGLCDLGLGSPELGYVRLSDLERSCGMLRLPVERDLYFKPKRALSAYATLARADGLISD